jgi:hypothetical protein
LLDQIKAESHTTPPLSEFADKILKVSTSYAPGLFYTYDVPGLPRTNNQRESEKSEVILLQLLRMRLPRADALLRNFRRLRRFKQSRGR